MVSYSSCLDLKETQDVDWIELLVLGFVDYSNQSEVWWFYWTVEDVSSILFWLSSWTLLTLLYGSLTNNQVHRVYNNWFVGLCWVSETRNEQFAVLFCIITGLQRQLIYALFCHTELVKTVCSWVNGFIKIDDSKFSDRESCKSVLNSSDWPCQWCTSFHSQLARVASVRVVR